MFQKSSELELANALKRFALYSELGDYEAITARVNVRLFTGFKGLSRTIQATGRFIDSIQASTTGFKTRESGAEFVETDLAATKSNSRTVKSKTSSLGFRVNSVWFTTISANNLGGF